MSEMIDAGRILILPKGQWNSATTYTMLDAVRYEGDMFIAKKTNTNITPTDGEYWMLSSEGAMNSQLFSLEDVDLTFTNYVATISDNRIDADTKCVIFYSNVSVAKACKITAETSEGALTFTVTAEPSETINCDILFFK